MEVTIWFWIVFNFAVVGLLLVDLLVFQRDAHAISLKDAGLWSAFWILLSLVFCGGIYIYAGQVPALEWLTAYVVEKSLSVDNIFVFVVIFQFFNVAPAYQHRVLFWGILGALIMRGVFILVGVRAVERFPWVIYLFGAFLIYTGIRMALQRDDDHIDLENNWMLRMVHRFLPMTSNYRGANFFVRENGKLLATPLLMVLILVEGIDLIFAVDSIPAVIVVTQDRFLAYTSNVCAILGLRALYFLLAGVVDKFHYLQLGLAIILTFVGAKMLTEPLFHFHVPVTFSLIFILTVLTLSIVGSLIFPARETHSEAHPEPRKELSPASD